MSVTDDFGLLYFIQNINDKSKPLFDKLLVIGKPKGITKDNISTLKINNRGAIIKSDGSALWENRLYTNSISDTSYVNLDSYDIGTPKGWLTSNKFWILFYNGTEFKILYNPIYRSSFNEYKSIYTLDASLVNENYCEIVTNNTDSNCPKKGESVSSNTVPLVQVVPLSDPNTAPVAPVTPVVPVAPVAPVAVLPSNKEDNSTLIYLAMGAFVFLILIIVGFFVYKKMKNNQNTSTPSASPIAQPSYIFTQ